MPVKLTVNIPDETMKSIEQIASDNNISKTEAIRQIIDNQRYLHDAVKSGSKLILEKDKNLREILLSTSAGLQAGSRS
jgi:hypothetical protein